MQTNQSTQPNQPRRPKLVRLLALVAALAALPASATTWTVTSTSDNGGFGTLRYALNNAVSGDTIVFNLSTTPATIALNSTLNVGTDVTIVGPSPDNLTLDPQQNDAIYIAQSKTVGISGLTITNGGGAIINDEWATLSLTNCVLADNASRYGGAIYNLQGATLRLTNCVLADNHGFYGGAIFNEQGTVNLDNCVLADNESFFGGAIFNDGSDVPFYDGHHYPAPSSFTGIATLTVTNCTVSDNLSFNLGGGIFNEAGAGTATLTIADCTFSGNSIPNFPGVFSHPLFIGGGAVVNDSDVFYLGLPNGTATMSITRSTFSNNAAPTNGFGGAVLNSGFFGTAEATISQSLVSSNTAAAGNVIANMNYALFYGGMPKPPTMAIANSTVSRNTTSTTNIGFIPDGDGGIPGGAILNLDGTLALDNVTLSGNSSPGIANFVWSLSIKNSILDAGSQGTNIIGDVFDVGSFGNNLSSDDGGGCLTGPGDQTNTDPMLGPLQDNGGPTLTQALLPGSPAIDAAASTDIAGNPVTVDQRGFPRPGGSGNDIGAYEVQRVAFASFDASKLRIRLGPPSSFDLASYFTLGAASHGINPLTEPVTLQIGTMTLTLPAGSFQLNHPGDDVFSGVVDGVSLNAKFHYEGGSDWQSKANATKRKGNKPTPKGGSDWQFKANATNANLLGTANPVTVILSIGDDSGVWTGNVPIIRPVQHRHIH